MSSISPSPANKISVVIPALNEGAYLRHTVEQLRAALPEGGEIIVVDDGTTDDSVEVLVGASDSLRLLHTDRLGVAGARNWGARHAEGEVIVFADAHVEAPLGWWGPLVEVLDNPKVGIVAPTILAMGRPRNKGFGMCVKGPDLSSKWLGRRGWSPYPVPMVCGCFVATRRDTFEAVGGFDEGLVRWGSNDLEQSLRFWLLGYEVWLAPQIEVGHLFRNKHPYSVDWTTVLHNRLRVAFVYFGFARIARVIEGLKGYPGFSSALARNVESNVWRRRAKLKTRCVHTDDWFFNRFGLTC